MEQADDVEFDGWTLNRNSGELRKAGRSIRLRPQPLQVLEELIDHPGEVVSRARLIARLWPKGIVDFDTALNSAVRRLRKGLRDDADTPKYIETIPRKGYRFIGSIKPASSGEPPLVKLTSTSALAVRHAAFLRKWQAAIAACALGAVGVWISIGSHERSGATATARSIAASETVSKAQVFRFLETQFAQADKNHDDALDADELALFISAISQSDQR